MNEQGTSVHRLANRLTHPYASQPSARTASNEISLTWRESAPPNGSFHPSLPLSVFTAIRGTCRSRGPCLPCRQLRETYPTWFRFHQARVVVSRRLEVARMEKQLSSRLLDTCTGDNVDRSWKAKWYRGHFFFFLLSISRDKWIIIPSENIYMDRYRVSWYSRKNVRVTINWENRSEKGWGIRERRRKLVSSIRNCEIFIGRCTQRWGRGMREWPRSFEVLSGLLFRLYTKARECFKRILFSPVTKPE